jgi:hypothetical protein
MKDLKVTKIQDLKKLSEGELVELPEFDENTPLVARLKRPSLLSLCKGGIIPNQLLGSAQELFEGRQRSDIEKYAEILDIIIKESLIEPSYDEIGSLLTDIQRMAIFAYSQGGINSLIPFRKIKGIQESSDNVQE